MVASLLLDPTNTVTAPTWFESVMKLGVPVKVATPRVSVRPLVSVMGVVVLPPVAIQ